MSGYGGGYQAGQQRQVCDGGSCVVCGGPPSCPGTPQGAPSAITPSSHSLLLLVLPLRLRVCVLQGEYGAYGGAAQQQVSGWGVVVWV